LPGLDPGIHVYDGRSATFEDVDARVEPGHDGKKGSGLLRFARNDGQGGVGCRFLHRNMVAFTTLLTSNGLSAAISLKGRQT
jgi:hypothetical protein